VRKETIMLIVNNDHLMRTDGASLEQCCPYCGEAYASYPLVMSDDPGQTVYHIACALELATDLLVDLYTFFRPPTPYSSLFTLSVPASTEGGSDAIDRS